MGQHKLNVAEFNLTSTWTCTVTYNYDSAGNLATSSHTQANGISASERNTLTIPDAIFKKLKSVKLHVSHTTGLYGGVFTVNGIIPDGSGFVELDFPESNRITVDFLWRPTKDKIGAHYSSAPAYTGESTVTVTHNHESPARVYDVYYLIETDDDCIYRAENGKLVPYQLYRAEDGVLVPYLLRHAEDGTLVPYG